MMRERRAGSSCRSSSERGVRVKGSVADDSRWRMAVERSMTALESGRTTGSDMGVIMMGSMNSSGTLPLLEEKLPRRKP